MVKELSEKYLKTCIKWVLGMKTWEHGEKALDKTRRYEQALWDYVYNRRTLKYERR